MADEQEMIGEFPVTRTLQGVAEAITTDGYAMPYIFTALKVAVTLATIGAIVGEYFGAPRASLGQYIVQHAAYFNFERSWAAIILAAAIGITLYVLVLIAERILMPWHTSFRSNEG